MYERATSAYLNFKFEVKSSSRQLTGMERNSSRDWPP